MSSNRRQQARLARRTHQSAESASSAQIDEAQFSSYEGVVPSPEDLQRFDEVMPGLAERLVSLTEREQVFRHDGFRMAARPRAFREYIGSLVGAAIVSGAIYASWYLLHAEKYTEATTVIVALVGSGLLSAILNRVTTKKSS